VDVWVLQWLVPEAALVEEFEEFQALPAGSSRLLPGNGQQVEEALGFRPR